MATENPLWGEERIANELLLKLAIRLSPRTVRKYMPKRLPGRALARDGGNGACGRSGHRKHLNPVPTFARSAEPIHIGSQR